MAVKAVKAEGLQIEIDKLLLDYSDEVAETVSEEIALVGKEALKMLKAKSPKNTGNYRKGWRLKVNKGRVGTRSVVYNAKKPQLTHLLENGHLKANGKGRVNGIPHIAPVNEWAEKEIVERIEKRLK